MINVKSGRVEQCEAKKAKQSPSGSGKTTFSWVSVCFKADLSNDSTPCIKFCCCFSCWTTDVQKESENDFTACGLETITFFPRFPFPSPGKTRGKAMSLSRENILSAYLRRREARFSLGSRHAWVATDRSARLPSARPAELSPWRALFKIHKEKMG